MSIVIYFTNIEKRHGHYSYIYYSVKIDIKIIKCERN